MPQTDYLPQKSFPLDFLENLERKVNKVHFQTWFSNTGVEDFNDTFLLFSVGSSFQRDWIKKKYLSVLKEVSVSIDGRERKIDFSINHPDEDGDLSASLPEQGPVGSPTQTPAQPVALPVRKSFVSGTPLNPQLTFEQFVVGPSNNVPYAASKAVAKNPGVAYNPFFIHGSVGLGKTHLLQGICHDLLAQNQSYNIRYISCETFINQFISAIQSSELPKFRDRYRLSDVLIIDDIHLLSQKERTQEEFFHTFNHLVAAGKQVVFSSDSPPHEIPSLQERLVSRFKMGLVGEIELPDWETRVAIVQHKARLRGAEFPTNVAEFIASSVQTNIRELQGAVIEVIGYSTLNDGKVIDLDLAKTAMKSILPSSQLNKNISIGDIFKIIHENMGITLKELQSKRRTQTTSMARHIAMYLARNYTRHSLQEIGGYMGGKDHSSVLYAVNKIKERMRTEGSFRNSIDNLVNELLGGSY